MLTDDRGDSYRGKWDPRTCTGNPCDSALVKDMLEACVNKGNESERNHSRAMTYEDMEALMAWSDIELQKARAAGNIGGVCEWLSFCAFAATGFTIWTRYVRFHYTVSIIQVAPYQKL